MSTGRTVDKQTACYTHKEILFSHEIEGVTAMHSSMGYLWKVNWGSHDADCGMVVADSYRTHAAPGTL